MLCPVELRGRWVFSGVVRGHSRLFHFVFGLVAHHGIEFSQLFRVNKSHKAPITRAFDEVFVNKLVDGALQRMFDDVRLLKT